MSKRTYKSWFDSVQRYVWNEDKTPYRTPVSRLNRAQADSEIFAFALFLGVLFGAVALVALTDRAPHGRSPGVSVYALTVALGAIALGMTKHVVAAGYCGLSPLMALAYFFVWGFPERMQTIDQVVMIAIAVLFMRYSWRVVSITQAYGDLPPAPSKGSRG